MPNNEPRRYRFGSIVLLFVCIAVITWLTLKELFVVTGTFAGIVVCVWLFMRWDDLVIWWHTRTRKKS